MDQNKIVYSKPVPPFVRYCSAIIPTMFDDSLSYYEALCALWKWLQDNLVDVVNNNATVTEKYIHLTNDLKEFVDNYFDNLDVQEEINNKLDAMVEDGTMAEIINQEIFSDLLVEIGDSHNPIHYGADPTGVKDSTQAINDCIQANKGGSIQFTQGFYKVSDSILLPFKQTEKVSIYGNGATIVSEGSFTHLFYVGYDRVGDDRNDVGFPSVIKDLYVDGSDSTVENAVYSVKGYKDLRIENCTFYRFKNGILIGESTGNPADVLITNSLFYGKGSEYEGVGIINNCSDNYFNEVRLYGFRKGFEINSYCTVDNVHVLLRWEDQTTDNFDPYPVGSVIFNQYYKQTMFADVKSNCKITASYADSVYRFLYIDTSSYILFSNSFYYNARTGIDQNLLECTKRDIKFSCLNCNFALKQGDDVKILWCNNGGYFNNYAQITLSGIEITGIANLTDYTDVILNGYTVDQHRSISVETDTWYVVKAFSHMPVATNVTGRLSIGRWNYELSIDFSSSNANATLSQCYGSETSTNYQAGVVYDTDNNVGYICFKASNTGDRKINFTTDITTNLCFPVNPVYQNSSYDSSRLLSNFTNLTPTRVLTLKQALGITNAS